MNLKLLSYLVACTALTALFVGGVHSWLTHPEPKPAKAPVRQQQTTEAQWVQTDLSPTNLTQVCGESPIEWSFDQGELDVHSTQPFGELCERVFYGNDLLIGLGGAYESSGFEFSYEAQVPGGKGLEIDAFAQDRTYHVGTKFRQNGQIMFHAARNPTTFALIDEGAIGSWSPDGSWTRIHVRIHHDNTFSVLINDQVALDRKPFNYGAKTLTHLTVLATDLGGRIRNLRHKGALAKG
jgi:hypothetical protein